LKGLRLELVAHTTDIETLIATAMLTTTSRSKPSAIFHSLRKNPKRVAKLVGRVEVQHGSILDHNRLCWVMDATEGEVLKILLRNRFFSFTRLGDSKWLLSSNLRTAVRYAQEHRDSFSEALIESLRSVAPTMHQNIGRKLR